MQGAFVLRRWLVRWRSSRRDDLAPAIEGDVEMMTEERFDGWDAGCNDS